MTSTLSTRRIVAAGVLAGVGLVFVGWFDYSATRRDLLQLLRGHAATLRQTVAAAAISNEAAGEIASTQVTERLLDNARLLVELDRKGGLTQAFLEKTASRNQLFRVAVFAKDGTREAASGGGGGYGWGSGSGTGAGRGPRMGMGMGGGPGGLLVERLFSGEEQEVVGQMQGMRGGRGGARAAAAVRRANGGAILVNADATEIEALLRQGSMESLIEKITESTPQLAYILIDRAGARIARGELPGDLPAPDTAATAADPVGLLERDTEVSGRPVLEFTGQVAFGQADTGTLRLGLRLDEVRSAERRMLTRLAVSLASALALSLLALGAVWLRQAYSALSEKHARAQAALRRRDRLSAMGELASTVAHEVRNPLNAIAMSAQRLRREFLAAVGAADSMHTSLPAPTSPADREELAQLLRVVEAETGRINGIVQQFLEFARPPRLAPAAAHLGTELKALVEAARPLASSREVTLETELAGAGTATFDTSQLRQAIDNMVRNAIEATPPGGRVLVKARTGGKGHVIEVRDTGAGIAAEDLPKIFDLYFTTKAEGTGVGLAVTQQIVAAHGGTIEVDSAPGRGTAMVVHLPADLEGAVDG